MRRIRAVLLLSTVLLSLPGCAGPGAREAAAEAAAVAFTQALRTPDDGRACAALAPNTREALEQEGPCPAALAALRLDVPSAPPVTTDVYGSQARVVFGEGNTYLAAFPDGWKVRAAGCVERPEQPDSCELKAD
ncbi:hypothetical protein [Streptomyces sp. NPDC054975]